MIKKIPALLAFISLSFSLSAFNVDTLYLCQGDGINYTNTTTQGVAVSWLWTFQGGNPGSSNQQNPATVFYPNSGIFRTSVKTTFDDGKDTTDVVTVVVYPSSIPAFYFPDDTGYCQGNTANFLLRTVSAQGLQYQWNTGAKTPDLFVSGQGQYWVDVVLKAGTRTCDSVRRSVRVDEYPSPSVDLGQDQYMCQNQSVVLDAGPGTNYKYLWLPNNEITRTIAVSLPGTYQVTVTNQYNCYATDEILLQDSCPHYVFIPNAVYPNGDFLNDVFIKVLNFTPLESTFSIYNRWGELLFESNDVNASWDCTVNDEIVPQDIYVYKLLYKDNDKKWYEFRGTFSVLR